MDKQRVNFVQIKEFRRTVEFKDSYQFRKDKKYHRLQRLCFWILEKIEAWNQESVVSYERVSFDTDDFIHLILAQQSWLSGFLGKNGRRILIGAEDFEKLMGMKEIQQSFNFSASYNDGRQIFGLEIEVIPWMRGILVLP